MTRNEFAGGDYKGAVIDSAHMINLTEDSYLKKQRQQKQQPQSNTPGIASDREVGPSAE